MPQTFISTIAKSVMESGVPLHQQLVLLPNQRAEIFIRESLKSQLDGPALLPLFITVDQFIAQAAKLQVLEPLVLLLHLHESYSTVRSSELPGSEPETLGAFLNWGQMLLADFGEIDRYLLQPDHILGDLYNVKKLEEWDLEPEDETPLMKRYSEFISLLPSTYRSFSSKLLDRGEAHGGLAARHLAEHPELLIAFLDQNGIRRATVAGLNALNAAELATLKNLREHIPTQFLWDLDPHYFANEHHEAGLFLRQNAQLSKVFGTAGVPNTVQTPSPWRDHPKTLQPIGASKFTGQAKAVAQTLERWADEGIEPKDIAVILADESLLNPVLSLLPKRYDKVNITMGYPLEQTALSQTFKLWMDVVEYAVKQQKTPWTFYYRSLTALFSDPMFLEFWEGPDHPRDWTSTIVSSNQVFTTSAFWEQKLAQGPDGYHKLLSPATGEELLGHFQDWLRWVSTKDSGNPITQNTAYHLNTLIEQLTRTITYWPDDLTVFKLMRAQLRQGALDFIGEPLEGLQVMGILESRTLDFPYVIIAGVNEGILPAGRKSNSLFPYDVKRHYALPTYEQKDAVYAYHFYRILQRCTKGILIFNTDKDGMGSTEPSRYITQLEVELTGTKSQVLPRNFLQSAVHANSIADSFKAERSEPVIAALKEWMGRSISASALDQLTARPDDFYREKLVGVQEADEVEESLSGRVMGELVHQGLENLYKPLIDKPVPNIDVNTWTEKGLQIGIDWLVNVGKYTRHSLAQGRNLVTVEVCRKMIRQFLEYDSARAQQNTLIIKGTETKLEYSCTHPTEHIPLVFRGTVDRLEFFQNTLHIWDYKTGKIGSSDLVLGSLEDLWSGKKGKPMQVLLYAWMLWKQKGNLAANIAAHAPFPWQAGMYKLQSSQPEYLLRGKAIPKEGITVELLQEFEDSLMQFLSNVLRDDAPFERKISQ